MYFVTTRAMEKDSTILHFDRFNVEHSVYPPGLYMAPHRDKLSRISIILDGELNESTRDRSVVASRNYVVIKPNQVVHENKFGTQPLRLLSISFNDNELFTRLFKKWQWIHHPGIHVMGIRLWTEIQRAGNEKALMGVLGQFISTLNGIRQLDNSRQTLWPEVLKQALESNLDESQSITQLSDQLAMHRVSLARGFRKIYGLSPIQFRNYARVMTALNDLATSGKSLAAIAYNAGFADQSHLTRTLRSLAGCTPAGFRKLLEAAGPGKRSGDLR